MPDSLRGEHIHFVTGRLAEFALRNVVGSLARQAGFDFSIGVMDITIAALMTPKWIARRLEVPPKATRVMVPGYCSGDLSVVEDAAEVPVDRGPRDLRELPEYFGEVVSMADYGDYDVDILAQIKNAPELAFDVLLDQARDLSIDGADMIVVTCGNDEPWSQIGRSVQGLCDEGHRVAVESGNPSEIATAVCAGAELVLSVDSSNREAAQDWGVEVVVVPDVPGTLDGIVETVNFLREAGIPSRIDPGLSPIGFGFAESLGRYLAVHWHMPEAELLMRVSGVTELTDADSAGINVVLLGFCQELGIRSVLTSQTTNRTQTSVRECDFARRLLYHAIERNILPRQLEPKLVMLRDARLLEHGPQGLSNLREVLRDPSHRIFAEGGNLHVITSEMHLKGTDPYELFELMVEQSKHPLEPSYSFYLGYEMAKAATALNLGKNYRQDEALDWGMLTVPEPDRRERRARRRERQQKAKPTKRRQKGESGD